VLKSVLKLNSSWLLAGSPSGCNLYSFIVSHCYVDSLAVLYLSHTLLRLAIHSLKITRGCVTLWHCHLH
jgi:hypothetical protein